MRAVLVLGLCLLLAAPSASALLGHVTVDVAGHVVTYTDPDPGYCRGHREVDAGVVRASSGAGGPYVDECRHSVEVL